MRKTAVMLAILTVILAACAGGGTPKPKPAPFPRKEFENLVKGKTGEELLDLLGRPRETAPWQTEIDWIYEQRTFDPITGKVDAEVWVRVKEMNWNPQAAFVPPEERRAFGVTYRPRLGGPQPTPGVKPKPRKEFEKVVLGKTKEELLRTVGVPAYTTDFGIDTLWVYDGLTLDRMTDRVDDMVELRVGRDGRVKHVTFVPKRGS